MQIRILSSSLTFLTKIIFPVLWIGGFGLGALTFWFGMWQADQAPPPATARYAFLGVWILGSGSILWFYAGLKRVGVDDRYLYVSNYLREIQIPLNDIEAVRENRWINIHPIVVRFKQNSVFGRKITFMPKTRFISWRTHPVVAELKQMAGLPT
jgi:hypothetical protein